VGSLSGGERNRLLLAKTLTKPSNLLILDEPTNDLDMDTLDVLEELLENYDGTLILISHDRDFLDRLVTSIISFDPDGKVREYAGGYTDMIDQRGTRFAKQPEVEEASTVTDAKTQQPRQRNRTQKLSYKEQRLLDVLPDEIDALELEATDIEAQLADLSDVAKITELAERLETIRNDIDSKQEQWLLLEEKRETIEQSKV